MLSLLNIWPTAKLAVGQW